LGPRFHKSGVGAGSKVALGTNYIKGFTNVGVFPKKNQKRRKKHPIAHGPRERKVLVGGPPRPTQKKKKHTVSCGPGTKGDFHTQSLP